VQQAVGRAGRPHPPLTADNICTTYIMAMYPQCEDAPAAEELRTCTCTPSEPLARIIRGSSRATIRQPLPMK